MSFQCTLHHADTSGGYEYNLAISGSVEHPLRGNANALINFSKKLAAVPTK
jgi:hypothetical protein